MSRRPASRIECILLSCLIGLSYLSDAWSADAHPPWTENFDYGFNPMGAVSVSDLTPDTTFAGIGYRLLDFNNGDARNDNALRVFPRSGGGLWVAGSHAAAGLPPDMVIARLDESGNLDPTYNGSGFKLIPSTFDDINDVVMGADESFYFVGTHVSRPTFTDTDVEVDCIDAAGVRCWSFGSAGVSYNPFDLGGAGHHDEIPFRITYFANALYVVGATDVGVSTVDYAAFTFKLDASTGLGVPEFGNESSVLGLFTANYNTPGTGSDVFYDVVAYAPSAGSLRVVMVGDITQADGYPLGIVRSLDGQTAAADFFIEATVSAHFPTYHFGELRRVIKRRDGGIVVAGNDAYVISGVVRRQLLMAAFNSDGNFDVNFGLASTPGILQQTVASLTTTVFGIVERPGSRDLVLGLNLRDETSGALGFQGVLQMGATGNVIHAYSYLDIPATTHDMSGNDVSLDGTRIVTAGVREYSVATNDYDMTVTRYVARDSIFADSFDG